ncbi:hypothetical protein BJ138DRAFT_1121717 [Hygrophoropsis aurantiaca]|uniref:Uncharacterized protein n=1 Tax=Hygrophoropsis aurantiaca TaxID=72124 RepID=A0ACB8AUU2_9AGAM|nr:hypothetical protein BJ138DRAFT_1121717 [Hygrophoropsis aurantiaca]
MEAIQHIDVLSPLRRNSKPRSGLENSLSRSNSRQVAASVVRSESPITVQDIPKDSRNVVIFGESGVGKSSVINAIAGQKVARTSSTAVGCTFRWSRQEVRIGEFSVGIWDTAGLDEGTYGTVPAAKAEENLKRLLKELGASNGIDLLVYCVRGTRVRRALLKNYSIFYSAICRKKVPIVLVITGLENHEGEMENWWKSNESEFTKLKMRFEDHACVTTLDPDIAPSERLRQRCIDSRNDLRQLIVDNCSAERWADVDVGTWVKATLVDVRSAVKREGQVSPTIPKVVLYDITKQDYRYTEGMSGDGLLEGWTAKARKDTFHVYRIHDPEPGPDTMKKISKRGADLLIFCADLNSDRDSVQFHFECFQNSFSGDLTPLVVVVSGADTREIAKQWWTTNHLATTRRSQRTSYIAHLPDAYTNDANARQATEKLQEVIKRHCLDNDDTHGTSPWCTRLGGRRVSSLWDQSQEHDDLLTRTKVWISG